MSDATSEFNKNFVKSIDQILIGAVLLILIAVGIFLIVFFYEPSSGITAAEFNAINTGMSYRDVINIIGEEGTLFTSVDIGIGDEFATQIFVWYGSNGISNANIMFQGGKVVSKAQIGLN